MLSDADYAAFVISLTAPEVVDKIDEVNGKTGYSLYYDEELIISLESKLIRKDLDRRPCWIIYESKKLLNKRRNLRDRWEFLNRLQQNEGQ